MKQNVKYLDIICKHTKFILSNNFITLEQVKDYNEKQYSKLRELENKKRLIRNKSRRCLDSSLKQQCQEEAKLLTLLIKSLIHDITHVMLLSIKQAFLFNKKKNQAKTTLGNQCLEIHK